MENTNNKQNNINNNFKKVSLQYKDRVYIKDQKDKERLWTVEEVNTNTYEIFHKLAVTHIDINKVYYDTEDNKYRYIGYIPMIENPGKEIVSVV